MPMKKCPIINRSHDWKCSNVRSRKSHPRDMISIHPWIIVLICSNQKVKVACLIFALTQVDQTWIGINFRNFKFQLLAKSEFRTNNFYPLLMADFKTVKTFTLLAKIGSGLSLSALFPAVKSSKAAFFNGIIWFVLMSQH